MMSNAAKCFDILATNFVILIVLMIQQNYFSDLCLAKLLNSSVKLLFFSEEFKVTAYTGVLYVSIMSSVIIIIINIFSV